MINNHRLRHFLAENNVLRKSQLGFLPNDRKQTIDVFTLSGTLIANRINRRKANYSPGFVDSKTSPTHTSHRRLPLKRLEGRKENTWQVNVKCQVNVHQLQVTTNNYNWVRCSLFADDDVILSPTRESLQQNLRLLHTLSQIWARTVNLIH